MHAVVNRPVTASAAAPTRTGASGDAEQTEVSAGPLAAIVLVGVIALAVAAFVARLQSVIGLTLAAVCVALITLPFQRWLQRGIGAVASMIVTALGTLAVCLTLAYVVLRDLGNQAQSVADLVLARLDSVRPGSFVDRVATSLQLDVAIEEWLSRVPSIVIVGDDGGTEVGHQLVSLLAVVILAAFFQSSGRAMVDWFVARWPRDVAAPDDSNQRLIARNFLHDVECRGIGYVRRSLVLAGASAAAVATICWLCGLPGAIAVGIWAGGWFVVPAIGPVVGLLPVLLLAALESRPLGWMALVLAAAVGAAAIVLRRRWIEPATLRVGAAPYVISAGIGIAIAGLGGSLVALVLGVTLCAALTNPHPPTRPPIWEVDPSHARTMGGITVPTGWRGALVVVAMLGAGVLVWAFLHRSAEAIVWLLIGGFVAIALSRPIAWLEGHTRLTRQAAAALLVVTLSLVAVVVTIAGADDGARATTTITERLPEVVADLEETRLVGDFLRDRDASVWISEQMNDLPQRLERVRPDEWLPTIGARLVDMFWTAVFALALLLDGPRLLAAAHRRVPARHRRQATRLTAAIGTALTGYAAGAALVAGINGTVVFTIAVALGVGLAPILAAWAFVWNFVPQIGGFMGGLPLILFALIAGPLRGLVAGLLYLAYQFVENHLIQPAVIGAAIDVPPWGTLVAALAGGAAAGVIGAVVITPLVGVVRVVRSELARDDFPGATVRTDPDRLADSEAGAGEAPTVAPVNAVMGV
jgi:predicted PurR-regulated permease PerM